MAEYQGTNGVDTLVGSQDDDFIYGHKGNDHLYGLGGADWLDGGLGADYLIGGSGDDTYIVDNSGDDVTEHAGEGQDIVRATVSYQLPDNVEWLILEDGDGSITGGAIDGAGNDLDNYIRGNSYSNMLLGGGGADTLYGGGGRDWLEGGDGNDELDGGTGADIMRGGAGRDTYYVDNEYDVVTEGESDDNDTVYASVSFELTDHVEDLILTGSTDIDGAGNDLDNSIYGNAYGNMLVGGGGEDWLDGGAGRDWLEGGDGHDVLFGGTGADIMRGGAGDDFYLVDDEYDVVTEGELDGEDEVVADVSYQLRDHVEHLSLNGDADINGTGNALDNDISGNSGDNVLRGEAGNDTLDGDHGTDTLYGGRGDDTYKLYDPGNDVIVEYANEGIDTVHSWQANTTLADNVENLILEYSAVNGTGNAAKNSITGNSAGNTLSGGGGNDTLDGREGADTMIGGIGNDWFYVDNSRDVVTENFGEGTQDAIWSSVTRVLDANVEVLVLQNGAGAINGYGNNLANDMTGNESDNNLAGYDGFDIIRGGAGRDWLSGGNNNDELWGDGGIDRLEGNAGSDTMRGGLDADTFIFRAAGDSTVANPDWILDFSRAQGDKIDLSQIDARPTVSGDQAFNFIGDDDFGNVAGQLRFENGLLQGDIDGNGAADFSIGVDTASLSANDFIL